VQQVIRFTITLGDGEKREHGGHDTPAGDSGQQLHKAKKVIEYLSTVEGRFEFVFTPKHASWLNLVESFFSKMTRQMLRGIRVESKEELKERIYRYFEEVNREPVVYRWKYRLEDVDVSEDVVVDTLPLKQSS
jgi:hypothetical protein